MSPQFWLSVAVMIVMSMVGTIGYTLFQGAMMAKYSQGLAEARKQCLQDQVNAAQISTHEFNQIKSRYSRASDVDIDRILADLGIMRDDQDR